jgi:uncharacterized protein
MVYTCFFRIAIWLCALIRFGNCEEYLVMLITLDDLRRFTVARNFYTPTTLKRAIHKMGFVQADPIRAPARAQDLILRHRVKNYCAGDLERRYATLDIEEDVFVMYGFVTKSIHALMHPRGEEGNWEKGKGEISRIRLILEFVRERGAVHPREVNEHFSTGKVMNYWGGSSNATTYLLEGMHYRGLLRVARREKGIRIYTTHQRGLPAPEDPYLRALEEAGRDAFVAEDAGACAPEEAGKDAWAPEDAGACALEEAGKDACAPEEAGKDACAPKERIDALVDLAVRIYAPLPGPSLSFLVRQLRYAVPQWRTELTSALERARERLSHARINGVDWYWPAKDFPVHGGAATECRPYNEDRVRLLAPFDPVVRDRPRFELLWDWVYRFEAYTPAAKRKLGYYALPLLWRDRVIGWGNLSVKNGELQSEFGYAGSQPRDRAFKRELQAELDRMRVFLSLG